MMNLPRSKGIFFGQAKRTFTLIPNTANKVFLKVALWRTSIALLSSAISLAQSTALIDQVVQPFVSDGKFMGSVLVARGNDVLFSKGYGYANLEWGMPNSPTTKFALGSITKQFTAASILLLEERGRLKVGDPIKKYWPNAPSIWNAITIFQLLTHTSAIPNITDFPEFQKIERFPMTPEEIIALVRDRPLEFEPGTRMIYSNSGYVVLGYLIEKVSGESYQKFVRENIFDPLGMKDSGYAPNSDVITQRASGYVTKAGGFANAGYVDMTTLFSAGGIYSTAEDLLRWEQGLFGGRLLSETSLRKMTTPFKTNYAFGLRVGSMAGRKMFFDGGSLAGFNSFLIYFPEERLTVITLGNVNGEAPSKIAMQLATLAHGERAHER